MNDLSMHVLDIVQNSVSAGAGLININVSEIIERDLLEIEIIDNGKGMSQEQVDNLTDPFFTTRTTRKVGMGIPLFKQTAQQSGGDLFIESELGVGTKIKATFQFSSIDRPPLGDIANAVVLLASSNPKIRFVFNYIFNKRYYVFDTDEINKILDGMPINNPSIVVFLNEMLRDNIKAIKCDK